MWVLQKKFDVFYRQYRQDGWEARNSRVICICDKLTIVAVKELLKLKSEQQCGEKIMNPYLGLKMSEIGIFLI